MKITLTPLQLAEAVAAYLAERKLVARGTRVDVAFELLIEKATGQAHGVQAVVTTPTPTQERVN